MTKNDDLAAEGDRLHAASEANEPMAFAQFAVWCSANWPALAAALRERDELLVALRDAGAAVNRERARCATAEADADRLARFFTFGTPGQRDYALAAHAAAVEARHD